MNNVLKILIAEDERMPRIVLAGVLKQSGREVVETVNGNEAWLVLQQPDPPRLLILDWMMPEMDGPELLRQIRAVETDRPPYVIMLTAKDEKDHIIAGLAAGANDYLTKPFDPGELIVRVEVGERLVEMQLQQHRQRANAQRLRVEAAQRMAEIQETLAAKSDELRRAQADLQAMTARLQAMRAQERAAIVCELHDSFGRQLAPMRADLLALDRHLQECQPPDPAILRDKIVAMKGLVERLTEQTQKR